MTRLTMCALGWTALLGCGAEPPAAGAPTPAALRPGEASRQEPSVSPGVAQGAPSPQNEGATSAPIGLSDPGPREGVVGVAPPPVPADPALIPFQLQVPTLAFDENSVVLVWHKPSNYSDVVDYHVYMDGELLGSAEPNNTQFSPAKAYIDGFYAADAARFHARATVHTFTVEGLESGTEHRFTARSVLSDGSESADSNVVIQRTLAPPVVLDVSAAPYNAVGNGTTLNTAAIQAAINACPAGGKVLVPAGSFRTGALFLKSDMTFEVTEGATLLGSEDADDYPLAQGYTLYEYLSERRPPSLLNAIDQDSRSAGTFENIRIVGKGTIDGNGWRRTAARSIIDEIGNSLPEYAAGNGNSVPTDGVLAGAQVAQAVASGLALDVAYSNRRSSLITLRGVRNVYFEGIAAVNPAFHGIMNLETENVAVNGVRHQTYDINNGDGIEFGNSSNIVVFNSFFDTGDDCINFAAGMGLQASTQPALESAWIFNNYFREGHGAVVAGSHTGAWIQDVLAEDNVMFHTDVGLRMKSNVETGGGGRDWVFRDSAIKDASNNAFIFTLAYGQNNNVYAAAPVPAQFRDVLVSNVSVDGATTSIRVDGFDPTTALENPENYRDVFHENIRFQNVALNAVPPASIDHLRDSSFENVVFTNVVGGGSPWVISNSPGVTFLGTTPLP
jgi:exo-poly-alpha-galacturonosidase